MTKVPVAILAVARTCRGTEMAPAQQKSQPRSPLLSFRATLRANHLNPPTSPSSPNKPTPTISYGKSLPGSLGNKLANRTFGNPNHNMTILSNPIPPPACGGHPYRNAFT